MLEVEKLSVCYGAHRALEDVSVHVAAGEICVILGANGAGKSSLLKAIGGLVTASAGARIAIDGQEITGAKAHRVVEAGVALVPEGRGIFGDMTVAENLQLGAYGERARPNETARLQRVLGLFPRLAERKNQVVRTMSGGEQQMVAIGRALMSNPTILMLDEPSLGLSPILTKDLFKSLRAVRETGVGILLVEQNAKQSLAIADRGYLIENGHITGEGTGEDLALDPAVQAAYLGGAAGEAGIHLHGRANGRRHEIASKLASNGETITMSGQAHDLSLQAAEFAKKAARIQREHVDARRVDHHLSSAAKLLAPEMTFPAHREPTGDLANDLGRQAAEFAARAARIHNEYVAAIRAAHAPRENDETQTSRAAKRKLTGRGKKLAKKAEKLARKAEKLAEKAIRISN